MPETWEAALDCPGFPSLSGRTLRRMALSRGTSTPDPDPDDVLPLKPCLLRRNHSRDQHGVAASCLEELRRKGGLLRERGGGAREGSRR